MPLPTGKHIGFTSMSSISPRWTSFARTHMFKRRCPKQQPSKQGLCSNCRPSLDDSPRRSLQHFWNQTYGHLAILVAAGEENQLGLHWPCKVDFGSALRAVSSMIWLMTFLGKQQHKITKNHQIQIALCARCAFCNLSNNTFNATVCTVDAACWLS